MWLAPAASAATATHAMEVTRRGSATSKGVQPAWPSSPEEANPQVYSPPEAATAAQWEAPHAMSVGCGLARPGSAGRGAATGEAELS